MHPRDLRAKYNLSISKLAFFLCRDHRTVERYCSYQDPIELPEMVLGYCWLLDNWFSQQGKVAPPPFLFDPTF